MNETQEQEWNEKTNTDQVNILDKQFMAFVEAALLPIRRKKRDDCSQRENFQREEKQQCNCKWPKWTSSEYRSREDVSNWCVCPGVRRASVWHRLLWHILELLTKATEKKCKKTTWKKNFQIQVRSSASPLAGREWWHESPTDESELYFVSWPHTSYSG